MGSSMSVTSVIIVVFHYFSHNSVLNCANYSVTEISWHFRLALPHSAFVFSFADKLEMKHSHSLPISLLQWMNLMQGGEGGTHPRFNISCSSDENVTRHVTVSLQWCASVQRHCFLWLSSQRVSLSICHWESKREHLATGKCHPSFIAHCHLEFSHGAQRAKADDTTQAPGATRQIGSREERETLGRGKQLDIWRLVLPLCFSRLA